MFCRDVAQLTLGNHAPLLLEVAITPLELQPWLRGPMRGHVSIFSGGACHTGPPREPLSGPPGPPCGHLGCPPGPSWLPPELPHRDVSRCAQSRLGGPGDFLAHQDGRQWLLQLCHVLLQLRWDLLRWFGGRGRHDLLPWCGWVGFSHKLGSRNPAGQSLSQNGICHYGQAFQTQFMFPHAFQHFQSVCKLTKRHHTSTR